MKKFAFITFCLAVSFCIIYLACTKKQTKQANGPIQKLDLKTGNKFLLTVNTQNANRYAEEDPCILRGGQVGFGFSWHLATCRSGCDHGIGFRCGRETFLVCEDRSHITISQSMGHCPPANVPIYNDDKRNMEGEVEFYDNGTIKIIFQKPMISEEIDNDIFEVEGDETIDFPVYLFLGGQQYSQIRILQNNYQINYNDGPYGSVILAALYIQ